MLIENEASPGKALLPVAKVLDWLGHSVYRIEERQNVGFRNDAESFVPKQRPSSETQSRKFVGEDYAKPGCVSLRVVPWQTSSQVGEKLQPLVHLMTLHEREINRSFIV